jgi:hypothetical protein
MTKFYQTGELKLSNKLNKMDYGVYNSNAVSFLSITDIFDKVYELSDKHIFFRLNILNENNQTPHSIAKSGLLSRNVDRFGVVDYFIDQYPIGLELFEQTDKIVTIYIETSEDIDDETQSTVRAK